MSSPLGWTLDWFPILFVALLPLMIWRFYMRLDGLVQVREFATILLIAGISLTLLRTGAPLNPQGSLQHWGISALGAILSVSPTIVLVHFIYGKGGGK